MHYVSEWWSEIWSLSFKRTQYPEVEVQYIMFLQHDWQFSVITAYGYVIRNTRCSKMDWWFSEYDYNKMGTDIKVILRVFSNIIWISDLVHYLWEMWNYSDIDFAAIFLLRLRHVVTADGGHIEEHSHLIFMSFSTNDRFHTVSQLYFRCCTNK